MAYVKAVASSISNEDTGVLGPGFTTLDAVALSAGDRILLTRQTSTAQNGVWIWQASGTQLARPASTGDQYATGASFDNATVIWVTGGTLRAGTVWGIDPAKRVTVDTTPHDLTRVSLPPVQCRVATTEDISLLSTHLIIDPNIVSDAMMNATTSPTTLTCLLSKPFTSADVGKPIVVTGAGVAGADLATSIAGYSSTSVVTLATGCSTSVTRREIDGDMNAGSKLLTCTTSAPFTVADEGKTIVVTGAGAGGADLLTSILDYQTGSVVELAAQCLTTVAGEIVRYGTTTAQYGLALVGNGGFGSDMVLVKDQTAALENGLYWASSSGAMSRCSEPLSVGRTVIVSDGNLNAHTRWELANEGAIVVDATSVRFSPQNLTINVRDFGAVGDGVTDDTDAIARALETLTRAGGGTLYFPNGKYRIRKTFGPFPASVTLRGDGPGNALTPVASILWFETPGVGLLSTLNAAVRLRVQDISIKCAIRQWPPNTALAVGDLVLPRQNVGVIFVVTGANTTGTDEPEWPTALDGSVTKNGVTYEVAGVTGAAIPTWSPQMPMTPGRLVRPPTPNGHYYLCIAAKYYEDSTLSPRTGASPGPTWPTLLGTTVTDGDVTWRPYNARWAPSVTIPAVVADPWTQLVQENGHIYKCTTTGTTGLTAPATWFTAFEATVNDTGVSTVVWEELGSTATGERVAMWGASRAVTAAAPQSIVLPVKTNGHFYKCTTSGTTGTVEPDWPITSNEPLVTDGTAVWMLAGDTLTGIRIEDGAYFHFERLQMPGWPLCIFLDGAIAAEIADVAFSGEDDRRGIPFPCFGSIGLLAGSAARPDSTNQVSVHDCGFNAPETGVWSYNGVNHHVFDNHFQHGLFSRFVRAGGNAGPCTNLVVENNSLNDPIPNAHCAIWIDGITVATTIRSNFLFALGIPALVIQSTIDGLTLVANRWDAGTPTIPQIVGTSYVAGSLVSTGNSFNTRAPRFDKPAAGTAFIAEPVTTAESLQVFGLNTLEPEASLHIGHGAGTSRPALAIFQQSPLYPLFEHVIASDNQPFKQLTRHRSALSPSNEPGTVVLYESAMLLEDAGTAELCAFRVPPDTVVLATFKVVARSDAGDLGTWSARQTFSRAGGGALTAAAAQVDEWDVVSGFPAGGAGGAPVFGIDPDDMTLFVEVTALVVPVTRWQVELTLRLVSTFATVADIATAVLGGGNLTITGTSLFSYATDVTSVIVTGDGPVVLTDEAILAGGGTVEEDGTEIVIPTTLLPGVAAAVSYVRVRANQRTVNVAPVTVT